MTLCLEIFQHTQHFVRVSTRVRNPGARTGPKLRAPWYRGNGAGSTENWQGPATPRSRYRLPKSKNVRFQESKSGVGVENCWKSRSSRESISKYLESKSESGVEFKKFRVEVGVGSRFQEI